LKEAAGLVEKARAFIFDLDGTLYSGRNFRRHLLFSRTGEWFSPADIWYTWGERRTREVLSGCDYQNNETYFREFFSLLERMTFRNAVFLRQWYFGRYIPRMNEVIKRFYSARPGTADLFKTIEAMGFPRAVYSDYPLPGKRLEAIGLDPDSCGMICGPETFGAQKPAPRPFLTIAEVFRRNPAEVLVVGDRDKTDGAGAAAVGMMYLRIASQNSAGALQWSQFCDIIMDKYQQSP
jgi:FMN phosphatase YigB (HAD superfamily)